MYTYIYIYRKREREIEREREIHTYIYKGARRSAGVRHPAAALPRSLASRVIIIIR